MGERLLRVSEVASIYADSSRYFAAVHHDTPRGLLVKFEGAGYDPWIVGCADPEAVKRQLERR